MVGAGRGRVATERITLATGVSAPLRRVHPVTLAHAASTIAAMSHGRFVLGLGIGERLNEHVTGDAWPRAGVRRRMLEEAIEVLRRLLAGDDVNHEGEFFTVEHARLYTRAATPPDLWVAVGGPHTARVAGAQADGMIGLEPSGAHVEAFERAGGAGKPVVGQLHLCLADSVDDAVRTVRRWWPQQALPAVLLTEVARPEHFASAVADLDDDAIRASVLCCTDSRRCSKPSPRSAVPGSPMSRCTRWGPTRIDCSTWRARSSCRPSADGEPGQRGARPAARGAGKSSTDTAPARASTRRGMVFIARDTLSSDVDSPGGAPSGHPNVVTIDGSPSISTRHGGSVVGLAPSGPELQRGGLLVGGPQELVVARRRRPRPFDAGHLTLGDHEPRGGQRDVVLGHDGALLREHAVGALDPEAVGDHVRRLADRAGEVRVEHLRVLRLRADLLADAERLDLHPRRVRRHVVALAGADLADASRVAGDEQRPHVGDETGDVAARGERRATVARGGVDDVEVG